MGDGHGVRDLGVSVLTWTQGSGHVLELVRSQGEGAPCLGVLVECARGGLAHGEGWGLGPAPAAAGEGGGQGHAPQLAGHGLLRAAGVVQRTCTRVLARL